jgi:hypothetical protein
MLEHTITYDDFNGNERTDTFFFHLTESSIVEIAMDVLGFDAPPDITVSKILDQIIARGNASEVMKTFKSLIEKSVGQKSEDGRRFIQTQDVVDDFMQSNAYQNLFMHLMTNEQFRNDFFEKALPPKLAEKFSQVRNEPREYTTEELMAMDDEQFYNYAGDVRHMSPTNLAVAMQRKNRAVA